MEDAHSRGVRGDAYWQTTREQLAAAQRRADLFSLLGLGSICALLWINHRAGDGFGQLAIWGLVLGVLAVSLPLWRLMRHRRRIARTRGLTCGHCQYAPHDTEILEVAQLRRCKRCERSLD